MVLIANVEQQRPGAVIRLPVVFDMQDAGAIHSRDVCGEVPEENIGRYGVDICQVHPRQQSTVGIDVLQTPRCVAKRPCGGPIHIQQLCKMSPICLIKGEIQWFNFAFVVFCRYKAG